MIINIFSKYSIRNRKMTEISLHWDEQKLNSYVALWEIGKTKYTDKKLELINICLQQLRDDMIRIKEMLDECKPLKKTNDWYKARGKYQPYLDVLQSLEWDVGECECSIRGCIEFIDKVDDESLFNSYYDFAMTW